MIVRLERRSAAAERERIEKILAHVARCKITLTYVVKRLFFPVYEFPDHDEAFRLAQAALDALVAEGRLERVRGESEFTGHIYVAPGHRINEEADLARLWFCYMNRVRRHLATYPEVCPLFEAEQLKPVYHNYSHCIADLPGGPVLLRLYLCLAEKKHAREQLASHIGQKAKSFRHWIDAGCYGVAVLVHSEQKRKEIEQMLSRSHGGKLPLGQQARFVVEVVPTLQTFPQAVKRHVSEVWK